MNKPKPKTQEEGMYQMPDLPFFKLKFMMFTVKYFLGAFS